MFSALSVFLYCIFWGLFVPPLVCLIHGANNRDLSFLSGVKTRSRGWGVRSDAFLCSLACSAKNHSTGIQNPSRLLLGTPAPRISCQGEYFRSGAGKAGDCILIFFSLFLESNHLCFYPYHSSKGRTKRAPTFVFHPPVTPSPFACVTPTPTVKQKQCDGGSRCDGWFPQPPVTSSELEFLRNSRAPFAPATNACYVKFTCVCGETSKV